MTSCTRFILFFLSQGVLNLPLVAGGLKYPVSGIDSSLVRDAAMVVRMHEVVLEVKSLNSQTLKIHRVVTILKGSASDDAAFRIMYDKYRSVDELRGSMYDAYGRLIRNFSSKDIRDRCATSDGILYSDDRLREIEPVIGTLPVTIEYYAELTIRRILLYPSFRPQNRYGQSIEYASLEILAADDLLPRYKEIRLPGNTTISGDEKTSRKWEFRQIPAREEECKSPSLEELTPVIFLNPKEYEIKGYKGDFSTWKSFGLWIRSLYKDRDSLPPPVAVKIRGLVDGINDPLSRTRIIYEYLQRSTRYVAVELGIGGYQPEPAEEVARLGYGDCKGLVNYASAMLHCIGIPSMPVLINAGEDAEPIQSDFPGNQFNHVILCVPAGKDTIWLECTSQTSPFGYLGSFTDDRDALLIGPDGGKIVRTPGYCTKENLVLRKTSILVDSAGSARVRIIAEYHGLMYESVSHLQYLSAERRREELTDRYAIPGLKIENYSCSSEGWKDPCFKETIELRIANLGSVNGNRIFLPATGLIRSVQPCTEHEVRENEIVIPFGYCVSDSIRLEFPPGYILENSPAAFDLAGPFGKINYSIHPLPAEAIFVRNIEISKGTRPATSVSDLNDFLKKINKQDNRKFVLLKKTP